MSLDNLITSFLSEEYRDWWWCCDDDFPAMCDLQSAIEIACRSRTADGRKHSHQWRLPIVALEQLENALKDDMAAIARARSFDELFGIVDRHVRATPGAGDLLAYDVTERIGNGFLNIEPDKVYLQRGSAKGAKYLGVTGRTAKIEDFPAAFQRLKPAQAEDFLCVYADKIKAVVMAGRS